MRVLTLNVWGVRGDWDARRSVLASGLRELEPDLVAFIEAIKTDEYDQVVDLLGRTTTSPTKPPASRTARARRSRAAGGSASSARST